MPTFARKPIFGYKLIAFSSMAIALAGFMVWAHHMFTSGLAPFLQLPFMISRSSIGVPTGIKIFSWSGDVWGGKNHYTTAMLFASASSCSFTSAVSPASSWPRFRSISTCTARISSSRTSTTCSSAVAHGDFSGMYYWFPKMSGRVLNETLGKWHFWLFFIGFNGTFIPMHWLGLGMPREVATYDPQFQFWNRFETVFSYSWPLRC